ncbi:MAG: hypothetical protein IPL32_10140 [Chloracidobacterium sp.]|nr:hypothetical protein [Chloracidobacterium sp.]
MRHCPICDACYDDETIKFCTKDGTTLVESSQPNFVILPSENPEPPADFGDETVIRRKSTSGSIGSEPDRIIVPTADPSEPRIRQRQVYYPPPEPPNTAKVVALTIVGTLVILSFGAGLFWLFQKEPMAINVNTNPINLNANLNSNLGFNSNFNFNHNTNANTTANYSSNFNFNFNFNASSKTPTNTPTPKQSPTLSPTPLIASPSPTPKPANVIKPAVSPSPRPPTMTSNRPAGNRN